MNEVIISIIVPCYNQAQYLSEALQSVLEQTYTNWECIIVNDGSQDDTKLLAKEWTQKDTRFHYLEQDNGGLSNARNTGINVAKGAFILPLDSDDKIASEYVQLALDAFETDKNLKVVYCQAEKFGDKTGTIDSPSFDLKTLSFENLIFCSAFYRKSDWERVGGYDENMKFGWEDWEFWIAILKNGGEVKRIEKVGFYYRIKKVSMLKQMNNQRIKAAGDYLSIKHADFFVEQQGSFLEWNKKIKQLESNNREQLKSEKFVIDLFCKTFFGFTLFGLYK